MNSVRIVSVSVCVCVLPIPAVGAVNNDVDVLIVHGLHYEDGHVDDGLDVLEPLGLVETGEEGAARRLDALDKLLQTVAHHVYVLDAHEVELNVRVVVLVLVAFALRLVRHRVDLPKRFMFEMLL